MTLKLECLFSPYLKQSAPINCGGLARFFNNECVSHDQYRRGKTFTHFGVENKPKNSFVWGKKKSLNFQRAPLTQNVLAGYECPVVGLQTPS